ncbi:MAG: hypothetical protein LBH39_01015 [Clostridiales Family XIII bacterium]|nr:hypothetical protein [Clostridiales Family XIII bacterium]
MSTFFSLRARRALAAALAAAVFLTLAAGCGPKPADRDADGNIIIPDAVLKDKDKALSYAKSLAINFNGKWADWHEAMRASGEGESFEGYASHLEDLEDFCDQSKSFRAYIVYSDDPGAEEYAVTMSYAAEPPGPGATCKALPEMRAAFEGTATAEPNAWDYNGDRYLACWSAYAPIYDGTGAIVAVLAIDFPAKNVRASYPDWNRDRPQWNGYTGE